MENYITENKIAFTVFGEPVSKQRPRTVRNKVRYGQSAVHTYTPSKTRDQEKLIAEVYECFYRGQKFEREVPLLMSCKFFMKIPNTLNKKYVSKSMRQKMISWELRPTVRNADIDNMCKLVMDALNGVAYDDDSQIVEIQVGKYWSEHPRTEIYITRLDDE